jgi:hypothetical protein
MISPSLESLSMLWLERNSLDQVTADPQDKQNQTGDRSAKHEKYSELISILNSATL